MAFVVLQLSPKGDHWTDISLRVKSDCDRLATIANYVVPSLTTAVVFDKKAMLLATVLSDMEADHHKLLIHPDVSCRRESSDDYSSNGFVLLPIITADPSNANFRKAVGFVLESAGPDKKFGNVWKLNPTQYERNVAEDNVITMP